MSPVQPKTAEVDDRELAASMTPFWLMFVELHQKLSPEATCPGASQWNKVDMLYDNLRVKAKEQENLLSEIQEKHFPEKQGESKPGKLSMRVMTGHFIYRNVCQSAKVAKAFLETLSDGKPDGKSDQVSMDVNLPDRSQNSAAGPSANQPVDGISKNTAPQADSLNPSPSRPPSPAPSVGSDMSEGDRNLIKEEFTFIDPSMDAPKTEGGSWFSKLLHRTIVSAQDPSKASQSSAPTS